MRLRLDLVIGAFLILFLFVLFGTPSLTSDSGLSEEPQSPSHADDAAAIAKAIGAFKDAYNQGDLEKTMAVFGDDLVYIGAGAPTRSGKEALASWRASLQDTFARYDRALDIVSEEIKVSGDMGIERGYVDLVLTPKAGGAPLTEKHRFLDVWEKQRGRWKLVVGMNNK
jgi:ketosteroid isomerase-like protein